MLVGVLGVGWLVENEGMSKLETATGIVLGIGDEIGVAIEIFYSLPAKHRQGSLPA